MSFKFPYKLLLIVNYHVNQHVNVKQVLTKPAPTNRVWTERWQNARDVTDPNSSVTAVDPQAAPKMLCRTALAANTFYINITKAVKSPCITTQTYHR